MKGALFMKRYKVRFSVVEGEYETIIFNNWRECFKYFKFFIHLSGRKTYPIISSMYFRDMVDSDNFGIKIKITNEFDMNRIMVGNEDLPNSRSKNYTYFTLFIQKYIE